MLSIKSIYGLIAAFGMASLASADTIIADYQGDYVAGTAGQVRAQAKADGWDYLMCLATSIGTASNYTELVYNTNLSRYTINSTATSSVFPYLSNGNCHPGSTADTYAIAAYTIQAGEAGNISIENSTLTSLDSASTGSDGIDYRIYVNNTLISNGFLSPGSSLNFNTSLGALKTGDTVYICVGNNVSTTADHFTLTYKLASVPEPNSVALLGLGASGAIAFSWLRRRNHQRTVGR